MGLYFVNIRDSFSLVMFLVYVSGKENVGKVIAMPEYVHVVVLNVNRCIARLVSLLRLLCFCSGVPCIA